MMTISIRHKRRACWQLRGRGARAAADSLQQRRHLAQAGSVSGTRCATAACHVQPVSRWQHGNRRGIAMNVFPALHRIVARPPSARATWRLPLPHGAPHARRPRARRPPRNRRDLPASPHPTPHTACLPMTCVPSAASLAKSRVVGRAGSVRPSIHPSSLRGTGTSETCVPMAGKDPASFTVSSSRRSVQ